MTIFPPVEETVFHIYKCPLCKRFFLKNHGPHHLRCAVLHSPGTCCHYGDLDLPSEAVEAVQKVLADFRP